MKESSRKYAEEAYEIVNDAAYKIGPRLPGSDNELKFHDYMADKLRGIGINPVREEFQMSPRSGIGGLPYAGYTGIALSALCYVACAIEDLWIAMGFIAIAAILWLVCRCFLYKTWFDMFFKREISQNTYGVLEPESGEVDYTIILSGHTDTSWCWKHSAHNYKYREKPILGIISTYGKVGFGAVCFFLMCFLCIFRGAVVSAETIGLSWLANPKFGDFYRIVEMLMHFIPIVTAIGCSFVAMWNDPNERNASRGAMDNATGIALSYVVTKYFKENPDKMPKNCRIIDLNVGSEEVGLRGAMAFADEHAGTDLVKNAWNINIDSVADKDYFEVVIKDDWQGCRFDTDMEKMFKDTFDELGIESKSNGCIHNPVGGCDSTPMKRAGIKTVTFAAQDPVMTYYYHTYYDMPERFEMETVGDGFDVVLSVIDKIAAFQETNGYNGPQTKVKK